MALLEGLARKVLGSHRCFVEVEDFLMDEVGDRCIDFLALLQETPGDRADVEHTVGKKNGCRLAFPGIIFPIGYALMIIDGRVHPR